MKKKKSGIGGFFKEFGEAAGNIVWYGFILKIWYLRM